MRAREYISYSQMMTVERSEKEYIEKYIYGEERTISKSQELGKKVAEGLEGKDTGDLGIDLLIPNIPNYEIKDKEIIVNMGEIPIMIKIDGLKRNFKGIIEHKTGLPHSWTQKKVDEWDQITFYCTGIYLLKAEIPTAKLVHIITEKNNGKFTLTGEIKVYDTIRSYQQVLIMMSRIKKAWEKIGEITAKELL